jgi:uncharacterized protein (DUF608 family)
MEFSRTGKVASFVPERAPERFPENFQAELLPPVERVRLLENILRHPVFYYKHKRIIDCDPALMEGDNNITNFLNDAALEMGNILSGKKNAWRDAVLCSGTELAPHEEGTILFTLGWFFPNHISPKSGNIGHMYSNWFNDSVDVCRHLLRNYDESRRKTVGFANSLFDTTLDYFVADSISAQLSTLVKCTWWTKDNNFGVWEGLGCCGFHTTDVTYYGSFSLVALFPSLQKQQMLMSAGFQREDGRIPHFFTPDFSQTDAEYDRVDMNPQFVLLAARDYLWTGDHGYLEKLWIPVVRAIENTRLLDADDDGLPDRDCERQTYDAWDFFGCPSYVASLWLASLKAGIRLAEEMQDHARAQQWRNWFEKGVKNFERLWNGEYYVLWKEMQEGGRTDECCMTDQINGDWFTTLMGWGPVLPPQRIRTALQAIFRYNYSTEHGLRNASYPPGKKPRISTAGNLQAVAPWTGIEYAIASMFIDCGMVQEGIEVTMNIYDRYLRAGRVWNHVECGDHYYRAMSSWALLVSLCGFRIDVPGEKITIAPALKQDHFRAPFVSSSAWGVYSQDSTFESCRVTMECRGGTLKVRAMNLGAPFKKGRTMTVLNGSNIPCTARQEGAFVYITFKEHLNLSEGDRIVIHDGDIPV